MQHERFCCKASDLTNPRSSTRAGSINIAQSLENHARRRHTQAAPQQRTSHHYDTTGNNMLAAAWRPPNTTRHELVRLSCLSAQTSRTKGCASLKRIAPGRATAQQSSFNQPRSLAHAAAPPTTQRAAMSYDACHQAALSRNSNIASPLFQARPEANKVRSTILKARC